jgi:4-aminobutyrate aminotransferase / (S)-3-amino-2-methylpropionate transaminase / 5-aminovalerate transaminase
MSYPLRDGGLSGAAAAARAVDMMEKQVGNGHVAAVLIEPIQGEGGFVVPAPGFLPAIAEWAREAGAVFIADEIQTGFCRTGSWFAGEHEGLEPDLVTTAKGMGGGLPIAGVVGRAEIMDAVHAGGLGGTYGGNPVACAATLAAVETMRELDLNAAARRIGDRLLPRLTDLAATDPGIAEARGRGAMLAIELVRPGGIEPDAARTGAVARACHEAGLLVLACGTYGNVLRLLPPLVIGDDDLDRGLAILAESLRR